MLAQSRRALEYLHPGDLSSRVTAYWVIGFAYTLQRDPARAREAYTEAIALSQASGNTFGTILATIGLGQVQKQTTSSLRQPRPTGASCNWLAISHFRLSVKRILALLVSSTHGTNWRKLSSTGTRALRLAQQYDQGVIDRFIVSEVFSCPLATGPRRCGWCSRSTRFRPVSPRRQQHFMLRLPEIAAAQVLVLLHQGNLAAAAHLAQMHELPLSQARVYLAQGDPSAALAVLEPWRQQGEARDWRDERLQVMVLQAVALQAHGEQDQAVQLLFDALTLAEPGRFHPSLCR